MHDPTVPPRHVNFGPFELDVRSGELRKGATRLKVPDQSIEILKALVKHLGELVTREDHRFESKAFRDELSRALESLGYQLRTDAATHPWLSVGLILCELVHPLVREPEQSRSITGAHLQPASPQDTHRTSSGLGRASIFVVGPLAERRVRPQRFRCARRQSHIVDDLRAPCVGDEQLHRFDNAAAGLIDRSALRVAPSHPTH
jgi:hypothetical protein